MATGHLQFRRNPAATWTTLNPILKSGEPGWETDTGKGKVGDGVTRWNAITTYAMGGGGGPGATTDAALTVSAYDNTTNVLSNTSNVLDDNGVTTYAGGTLKAWIQTLLDGLVIDSVVNEVHRNNSNVHGVADLTRGLYKNANGVYRLNKATTLPPLGTNPPADSIDFWVNAGQGITFRNKDGDEVQLLPTWKDELMILSADTAGVSDGNLVDFLTSANNLVAGADYAVSGVLHYTALGGATGGLKVGWAGPAGATFDWGMMTLAPGANALQGEGQFKSTNIAGTVGSGGNGANRLMAKIEGLFRMGGTAGKPTARYAQTVAAAGQATIIRANSFINFERVQ